MKAPARWLEDPDALPDELLASMEAYREQGPSEQELAQIRVGLRLEAARGFHPLKLLPVVGAALIAAVWLGWPRELRAPVQPAAPVHAPPVPEPPASRPAAPSEPAAESVLHVERAPVGKPRLRKPKAAAPASDPASELVLLQRARRALAAAPATSLALTDEHARTFPQGAFAQERELIAIEALSRTDHAAALARARAFAAKYPSSAHRERIEVLLEER